MITIDDFKNVEMRIGEIVSAERVEGSEKLLHLKVDFGEEKRSVVSGIAKYKIPEEVVGRQAVFVTNLEPREILGLKSEAMILAIISDEEFSLLTPEKKLKNGSKVG